MARQIKIEQIDDLMKEAVQELVQNTTLRWTELSNKATPVDTGNLRNGWKTDIKKFKGTIINNVEFKVIQVITNEQDNTPISFDLILR